MRRGRLLGLILPTVVGLSACADDVSQTNLSGAGGTEAPGTTTNVPFETTIDPTIDPDLDTGDSDPDTTAGDDDDDDDDATTGSDTDTDTGSDTDSDTGSDTDSDTDSDSDTDTETDTGSMAMCGDGDIEGDETCDGRNLDGNDCVTLGFDGGPLGCLADCSDFDTSACFFITCGNDMQQLGEVCDGIDLVGEDCISQGFDAGTLGCLADCSAFDFSACVVFTCGNDTIEGAEVCDGMDLAGEDCVSLGFEGGTLGCAAGCAAFDTSACFACGDDVVGGPEVCDGMDLAGEDCESQGFDAGTLTCLGDCTGYDTTGCVDFICGNDTIEGTEVCDGMDLAGEDCISQGFDAGTLGCLGDCSGFDVDGCIDFVCGNDMIEGVEVCDGADLAGLTCIDFGFAGGTLACAAGCGSFDTSGCLAEICGNDTVEGTEVCDGMDLAGEDCVSQGFDMGTLACLGDCSGFDTSGCSIAPCEEEDLGSTVGPAVGSGNTDAEDNDLDISCAAGGGPDRVLRWVAPADGDYVFDTLGSDYDTALAVFDSCDPLSEIDCNDDTIGLLSQVTLSMTAGQEVRIVVDGFSGDTGNWVLNIGSASCGEETIGSAIGSAVSTGSTVAEDDDFGISCAAGGGPDRVIEFIPPQTGAYDIDTFGSDYDSAVAVFDGCDPLSELACDDDTFGVDGQVNVSLTAGVPVAIVVDGFLGSTGNYVLNVQSLVCVDTDIDFTIGTPALFGDTTGEDDDLPLSCAGGGGADTVVAFTAPVAATYVFDTVGSGYDTALSLYDSCGSVELDCNDDTIGVTSELTFAMAEGQTVLVVVDGFLGSVGPFDLNITQI